MTLTITKSLITNWLAFKDEVSHYTVLVFKLSEDKQPLHRKYFQGEYGGAKLLTKLNITKVEEVSHVKYEEILKECIKLEALTSDAIELVK